MAFLSLLYVRLTRLWIRERIHNNCLQLAKVFIVFQVYDSQ